MKKKLKIHSMKPTNIIFKLQVTMLLICVHGIQSKE
jgi:hypothetical protein